MSSSKTGDLERTMSFENLQSPGTFPRPGKLRCLSVIYRSSYNEASGSREGDNRSGKRDGVPLIAIVVAENDLVPYEPSRTFPYYLKDIREHLLNKFQLENIPDDYTFASRTLAKIRREDEAEVRWSDVATAEDQLFICSPQAWILYSVVDQYLGNLGEVKLSRTGELKRLRESLDTQLLSRLNLTLKHFRFPNGLPVALEYESVLQLFDVCSSGHRIGVVTGKADGGSGTETLSPSEDQKSDHSDEGARTLKNTHQFFLRPPPSTGFRRQNINETPGRPTAFDRRLSFKTSKNMPRQASPMTASSGPAKKFLISYVHSESRDRAITLKQQLEQHGCTVFIDFENIAVGMDWQDVLNDAVKRCEVFVPLISVSYGETQWTNREVKLADILNKIMVPVSLINSWPPSSLAIQFATTQYISWRLDDQQSPGSTPPETERDRVKRVANEIMEQFKHLKAKRSSLMSVSSIPEESSPPFAFSDHDASSSSSRGSKRPRCSLRSYPYEFARTGRNLALEEARKPREGLPLIVVCAHPSQKELVQAIRDRIGTSKYIIWATSDFENFWAANESSSSSRISLPSSLVSGRTSISSPSESVCGSVFQEKADEAGIIILLLSAAFASNNVCRNFVFYVERRKRIVPVVCEDFSMPGWMTTLIGNKDLENWNTPDFIGKLQIKLNRAINLDNHAECSEEDLTEVNILRGIEFLKNNGIPRDRTVYISGSGSNGIEAGFLSREIAAELAKLPGICITTGGCKGVGEAFSFSFKEARKNPAPKSKQLENLFHVLPTRDDLNQTEVADQNDDGTFNPKPTGKTFFVGKSLRERETLVGRYFKVCILIDGDCHAAHEATEAMWADNIVLPVVKTGGAAGGDFDFRMETPPNGVSEEHWAILRSKDSSNEEIAVAIREIIEALLPEVGKEKVKKPRTPRTPRAQMTPTSSYGLRDRKGTGKKRVLELEREDSVIVEEAPPGPAK